MTSILVLGVGFIGFNVALELKKAGYSVYGMSIEESDRLKMMRSEIIPIIGDVTNNELWIPLVDNKGIDTIIECVSSGNPEIPKLIQNSLIKLQKIKPNIQIIFTNASFLLGSNDLLVDENSAKRIDYIEGFKKIAEIESIYQKMGAIIIIPTMIYGLNNSYCSYYFECVKQSFKYNDIDSGSINKQHIIKTYGNSKKEGFYQGFIHIHDLTRIYLLVVENAFKLKGESFIANAYTERVDDLLKSIYRYSITEDYDHQVANSKGKDKDAVIIEYVDPPTSNLFLLGMTFNQRLSYQKLTKFVGYHPYQPSFINSISTTYNSWKNSNDSTVTNYIDSVIPK